MSSLTPYDKARIAERVAEGKPAQTFGERFWDSGQKQTEKSEHEAKVREKIAIGRAVRDEQ